MSRIVRLSSRPVFAAAWFVASVLLAASAASASPIVGQIDNFQDGTTDNWTNGRLPDPVVISTGGPAGSGDEYLQVSSGSFGGGPRLVAFNDSQWAGNFAAAGVSGVAMDLQNFGTSALSMRIALRQGTGGS